MGGNLGSPNIEAAKARVDDIVHINKEWVLYDGKDAYIKIYRMEIGLSSRLVVFHSLNKDGKMGST